MTDHASSELNLVTGGTGLLGSHIAEQLRRRGRPVRALVRPGSDTAFLQSIGAELTQGDITDAASVQRAMIGVSVVYHAAARVGDWGPWEEFERVTIHGTLNVLRAAEAAKVRRFVHISSISAYGHPDGEGLVLDETAPLGQNLYRWSYYSRAKVAAEELVWDAHRSGRLAVTVIRPSWLYGPRDRASMGRLVENIRKRRAKLVGGGDNRLNVVHAGNVAEAAIAAADSDAAIGQAYNCSNDGVLLQRDYFNMVAAAIGEPPVTRRVPYKVAYGAAFVLECLGHLFRWKNPPLLTRYGCWLLGRRSFFETKKAREQLGWKPSVSYEVGIPAAVRAYLNGSKGGLGSRVAARPTACEVPSALPLDFPQICGFQRSEVRRYEDPKRGYSVAYHSKEGMTATVYVYNLGLASIPDGICSPVVRSEMARATEVIKEAQRQGIWQVANVKDESEVRLGDATDAPQALRREIDLRSEKEFCCSELYLMGHRNHFIKVRTTYSVANRRKCEQHVQQLLGALGDVLAK